MTVLDINTRKPFTRSAKDDPIIVTRENWEAICDNARSYKELFVMVEKRLQKLEQQVPSKPNWWEWWR